MMDHKGSEPTKEELAIKQLKADYKRTFNSAHGKRVYRDVLERCHIFHTTFTGNSKTFFLEGERNIGLYLLAMVNAANHDGLEIIQELENDDGF